MNQSADSITKELISQIGKRIRDVRQFKGMSLDVLSKKTRFSKGYLSEIETLKKEPPISTLSRIAFALEVDLNFLFTGKAHDVHSNRISIVRSKERHASPGPYGSRGYIYESLTYEKIDRLMDAYIVTVGPEFPPKPFIHEGQEVVYVLEGTQELNYDGETYFIKEGDCVCLDSDRPHYSRTVGGKTGKVLVVLATKGG